VWLGKEERGAPGPLAAGGRLSQIASHGERLV